MTFNFDLDQKGYVKKRESFDLEYKQNFQLGDQLLRYLKTLVGMANNKGGQIIFGIQDKPHYPVGMTNNKLRETDNSTIDRNLRDYFSQELIWSANILEFNGKEFGQLCVKEAEYKPVLCKKNKDGVLREGAIYYRYRAETKEIEYSELKAILEKEKEKEKLLWMSHIQKIAQIGPQNVNLFDTYRGEISVGNGKILLDKSIIDKLNFIREGRFTETNEEGAPTLKLVGEIEGLVEPTLSIPTDILYPLFTKDLQEQLNLNSHQIKCVLWKLKVKGNKKYHTEVSSGKNSNSIHKYTESLIPVISRILQRERALNICIEDYRVANPVVNKKKLRKRRKS